MDLIIADKTISSWSMRPWLALKRTGQPFNEVSVKLRQEDSAQQIRAAGSPSGQVPVLKDGDLAVWDSLAICEYLADRFPEARLWPQDPAARALGRSASAEMHSRFASLRGECPMDLSQVKPTTLSEATAKDLHRLVELWGSLRRRFQAQGPYLLGAWSIADAFYTPTATRLRTYGVRLSDYGDLGPAAIYAETLLEEPDFREWEEGAAKERAA